jgi:hypothetical protein
MTIATVDLVAGDNLPFIGLQLTDAATGDPIDLSPTGTAAVVQFRHLNGAGSPPLATINCSYVTDGTDGKITFNFPGDTLDVAPGQYEGQIVITFGSGNVQTVFDLLRFRVRAA